MPLEDVSILNVSSFKTKSNLVNQINNTSDKAGLIDNNSNDSDSQDVNLFLDKNKYNFESQNIFNRKLTDFVDSVIEYIGYGYIYIVYNLNKILNCKICYYIKNSKCLNPQYKTNILSIDKTI